jgi:hypothetical protein
LNYQYGAWTVFFVTCVKKLPENLKKLPEKGLNTAKTTQDSSKLSTSRQGLVQMRIKLYLSQVFAASFTGHCMKSRGSKFSPKNVFSLEIFA